jgi:hypothetical protein
VEASDQAVTRGSLVRRRCMVGSCGGDVSGGGGLVCENGMGKEEK